MIQKTPGQVQLPPIFAHRNRRNYRDSNQFSEFDNRWDHDKKKRIDPKLTLRYNYESPEIIVSSLFRLFKNRKF